MQKLSITNYTRNSNFAIYLGAYVNIIHNLAILGSSAGQTVLHITPFLEQMNILYKIYFDESTFLKDIGSFRPDTLLYIANKLNMHTTLDKIASTLKIDVICTDPKEPFSYELLQGNWYSVVVYNPKTTQTTHIYHTNAEKNIPLLKTLNNYQTIKVE